MDRPGSAVLTEALHSPDAIAHSIEEGGVASVCAVGWAKRRPDGSFATGAGGRVDTLFDLASVTKPMTAIAFARSGIDRSAPLGSWLEEARGTPSADVACELFLAHRAGLLDHVPLFLPLVTGSPFNAREALVAAARGRRDDASGTPPAAGFPPIYSDLGYALVGEALARATRAVDAGAAIRALVALPFGLGAVLGTARDLEVHGLDVVALAAPTEDVPWRGGVVRGRVHDENAWALTGTGGSGHAGMFGTVDAVLRFGCIALEGHDTGELAWLTEPRPGGTLRAGFDGKSPTGSSAGDLAGPRTFGHLGFTGTSLWIDPDAQAIAVLLTNRVHPSRTNQKLREARPRVHDALFALARASV